MIDQCLQHMTAWVLLTEETLSAEFPAFHVQNAFACFNVTAEDRSRPNAALRQSSQVAKLCQAFHLPDKDEAMQQLEKFRHVAAKVAEEEGLKLFGSLA